MIPTNRTFIIAELSANHNNDFELAVKTIQAMAESGADAVKIQTYKPESLTIDCDTGYFAPRISGLWKGYTPWNLYREASMPYDWQPKLKKIAEDLGMIFFSSPFDFEAVDFLEEMACPIYKVASAEITDLLLIEYMAKKMKPMIISTGMASLSDIDQAINICYDAGNKDVAILKCTAEYPAPVEMANLLTIPNMISTFGVRVGVSDHTFGATVPIVSVTLGATIVEKHFILDRNLGGPDSAFSMEPKEFAHMVNSVRETEKSLGQVSYKLSENNKTRRRSLFITKDINEGDLITIENVRSIRPGFGLSPKDLPYILGKRVNRNLKKGEPFQLEFLKQ